jgi:tRNA threonylcarbamoyladenosine modification (KEOPS) complex Cgi121 subunit
MSRQTYLDLQEKHREELNNFPVAYAFSDQQLQEALKKLGVKSSKECVTVFGHGDIVKKENAKPFIEMLKRHTKEIRDRMIADEEFAEAAFLYELDNHEYAINWDGDEDVLGCFGLIYAELEELGLHDAYHRAVRKHMKHAEEWGMI